MTSNNRAKDSDTSSSSTFICFYFGYVLGYVIFFRAWSLSSKCAFLTLFFGFHLVLSLRHKRRQLEKKKSMKLSILEKMLSITKKMEEIRSARSAAKMNSVTSLSEHRRIPRDLRHASALRPQSQATSHPITLILKIPEQA